MNTAIESAFLAAVRSLPELADAKAHTGVSGEANDPEEIDIIVRCDECEHTVGSLWKATVVFRLESPAYDNALDGHDARFNAVRTWLENRNAVSEAVSPSGMRLCGYCVRKSGTATEDKRWIAEIEIVAGVDTRR